MTSDSDRLKHRAPNVFDYSTLIEDAVTFYVNNKLYEGWKSVNVTRTLNSVTGTFSITLLDKFTADRSAWELTPGKRAHLHLGKNPIFEGYIENMDVSFSANARNVTIQGRDRVCDIVDCAAVGNGEYDGLTLTQISEKLLLPFGLKTLALTDVGDPFPKISIKPSEKVFEVLHRLARQRGLLLYSSTHGNLIINKKAPTRAVTDLVQGVNVLSASANFDNTDRFSEYIVKSQNDGLIGSEPDESVSVEGKALDSGMGRHRPTVIIAESAGDGKDALGRAQWEATFRAAKAMTIKVVVQGWREKDGKLWDINKLVYLNAPKIGVQEQFLINAVTYTQSETEARTCELELVRKDAYDNRPVVEAEDDPLAGLGL